MAVQCTGSIAPGPGRIRDFRHRLLGLFDLQPTVTLYDLTNTYFEGEASEQPQARRGHSKEKRSDCPLLTLALCRFPGPIRR